MATHSSILAWRISEEPGRLQSIGLQSQTQQKRLSIHTGMLSFHILISKDPIKSCMLAHSLPPVHHLISPLVKMLRSWTDTFDQGLSVHQRFGPFCSQVACDGKPHLTTCFPGPLSVSVFTRQILWSRCQNGEMVFWVEIVASQRR